MRHACLPSIPLALLLACPGDDGGGETGAVTTTDVGTGPATTTTGGSSGPVATSDATGSATTTASTMPPGDGSSSSGGGPSPLDVCLESCARLEECMIEEVPNCGIPCANIEAMTAGCGAEYVAQQQCALALTCEELQAWVDAMIVPGDHPCMAEDEALQTCQTDGA
jgi:hypothetical protein